MKPHLVFALCSLLAAAGALRAQPAPSPGPTNLDHFNCYFTQGPKQPHPVLLLDEFDTASPATSGNFPFEIVTDLTPFRFCNPVQKTTSSGTTTRIQFPDAHLLMYRISNQPDTPRLVTIQNQFTSATTLITGPAVILAVPSTKVVISSTVLSPPPSVQTIEGELDHFKCYAVSGAASVNTVVTLVDQFSPPSTNGGPTGVPAQVLRPFLFCNPVLKIIPVPQTPTNPLVGSLGTTALPPTNLSVTLNTNVTQVNHPEAHLTCYLAAAAPAFKPLSVFYSNQFVNTQLAFAATLPILPSDLDLLCVPSFKTTWQVVPNGPPS